MPEVEYQEAYETNNWKTILNHLDEKYRIVLELYYVEGFSTKEIAKLLHIKDVNVRSRMSRGRKQLEQYLQEYSLG